MAGYRRVNYYELCRLCTSSEGTKMHIFREEGRRRQLPTKIQICLPLQVCEDDSLPKIICSHCVDKLESFYDFRESCVNAEAMLESYFTSLRYSDDFTREGKVYVKDESPIKKKASTTASSTPEPPASPKGLKPAAILTDGLNSLVQAAGIQIVADEDGTRVQQYKCQLQVPVCTEIGGAPQSAIVEAAEARYTYEPCNTNPRSVEVSKVEDGSTQCSENDFNTKAIIRQQTPESSDNDADMSNDQQPTLTFTADNQIMATHYTCTKDRSDAARSSIAQIGEFLRIKSVNIDATNQAIIEAPTINLQNALQTRINCERCQKQYLSLDEFQTHQCIVDPNDLDDKNSPQNGGNFACEVCGKPFKRKEHLFQHRKLHTGERPYVCTSCGKAFSRKEHLVRHAVSHTGQKVHACDLCGKTFSRKDNLHKHRKTHGIAGPYICETCGKSFVVKHYYLMHKGTHGTGQDTDTGQPEDGSGMEAHEDDPLSFKCDICNKGFATKSYLTSHKQRHKKAAANAASPQQKGHPTLHGIEAADAQQLLSRLTEGQQHILSNNQPLTTINNAALLAPNILHHVGGQPSGGLVQVSTAAATAYLCAPTTVAASELIETYRRLHSA